MKKYFIITILLILFGLVFGLRLYYLQIYERSVELYEEGKFCESLKDRKILTFFSKNMTGFYGTFYAQGLCLKQDIEIAKKSYQGTYRGEDIGETLFYDGIEAHRVRKIFKMKPRIDIVRMLFIESKKLGYKPDSRAKKYLAKDNLDELYKNCK